MATILNSSILNSAILDSAILHKTLTQTSSIWLKLIHSHSTWWWQSSWTLPSWIQPFCFTHSFWLNLMMAAIFNSAHWIQTLPSWIQPSCYASLRFTSHLQKHSDSTLTKDSNSFNLTQLDDGNHLEFCHLGFSHFAQKELQTQFILTQTFMADSTWMAMLDWLCHLGFKHLSFHKSLIHWKHSSFTLTLTQTNSIWLT